MPEPATTESAIAAALAHNWKEAIRINTILVAANDHALDALNRLGYAYLQNGQAALAKASFSKVLVIDPYNQVATKHTKRLSSMNKKLPHKENATHVSPLSFLEEPGVTKIVAAINLAPVQVLSTLSPGMELILKPRKHCVEVRGPTNEYIAALPDDLSFRLLRLIASGNRYQTIIKSVDKKVLFLILREVARGKKFANQPSFTSSSLTVGSDSHALTDRGDIQKPVATPTGEGEDEEEEEQTDNQNPSWI